MGSKLSLDKIARKQFVKFFTISYLLDVKAGCAIHKIAVELRANAGSNESSIFPFLFRVGRSMKSDAAKIRSFCRYEDAFRCVLLAIVGVRSGCTHWGAGAGGLRRGADHLGPDIFTKNEFLRLDEFSDEVGKIQSFPNTDLIGVIGWSVGGIVKPNCGEITARFSLPKRNPTIVHTKQGFLLLYTGAGFSEIRALAAHQANGITVGMLLPGGSEGIWKVEARE